MDCREVAEQLYEYLDRELTPDEVREVHAHLHHCPDCFELVAVESGVIKLVKRECGSVTAPACLREKLEAMFRA